MEQMETLGNIRTGKAGGPLIAVRTSGEFAAYSGWWGARIRPTPEDVTYWARTVANLYPRDGVAIIIRRET